MSHAARAQEHRLSTGFIASLATCALYGRTPVPQAISQCEELLARAEGDRKAEALILWTMSHLEAMGGSFDRARELYRQSRAMLEELGWKVRAALTSLVSGPVEMLAGNAPRPDGSSGGTTPHWRRWGSTTTSRRRPASWPRRCSGKGSSKRPRRWRHDAGSSPPPTTW